MVGPPSKISRQGLSAGIALGTALLMLAGCTTTSSNPTPPLGTGWSRAPDLSVYGAMDAARSLAIEEDVLCWRRNPAVVEERWRAEFGAREEWIAAALASRYGTAAVEQAASLRVGREPCPTFVENRWRKQHARLLRLLELRLYPRDHRRQGG